MKISDDMTTPEREKFEKWVNDTYPNNLMMRNILLDNKSFFDVWQAALSAAPTPPVSVPNSIPLDTLITELEADPEMKSAMDDARKTVSLEGWSVTDLPTPPEIEPVAYKITTRDGKAYQFMIVGHPMEGELMDEAVALKLPIIPLYASPPSHKAEYDYALRLVVYLAHKFHPDVEVAPCDSLMGLLSQIDNIIAGINKAEWDAEGNPLNLLAAARDALDKLVSLKNRRLLGERDHRCIDNLRKFIGEEK